MRRVLEMDGTASLRIRPIPKDSTAIQWGRAFIVIVVAVFAAAPLIGFLSSLAILTIVGFGATLLGFGRRGLGVLGVTVLCTIDPIVRNFLLGTGGFLRWNTFNYVLLVFMVMSTAFIWRLTDPHSKILKAFVVLLAVDLIFSPDVANGVQHLLGAVTAFGLLACLAQGADDPDVWYMVGLVNGTVGAAGGLAFLLMKDTLPYMNTNAWALFPETAVFAICLGFRSAEGRGGQLTLAALAVANAMWTFLSGSRGGMLIVGVGLLFILLSMRRTSHRVGFAAVALVTGAVAFTAFGDMETYALHRINKMLDAENSAVSRTNGRSDLALAGLYMARQRPLGVGTGGFGVTWSKLGFIPGLSTFKRGEEFAAHSGWIKVVAENGWPGFLLMVAYVGSFMVYGFRSRTPGHAALGTMVTAAIAVSFLSTEFQGKAVWFLAAGATAQLHPEMMAKAVGAQVERAFGRPRRLLSGGSATTMNDEFDASEW